tara:strand:- start:181 stop:1227 length:1047 start_codon:yes stop_codon:yes gene_type:complete
MSILKVDAIRHNSATSDAITMASDGTCTAKVTSINGGSALSHRNILINGSCAISQRGTSFSGTGFTLDRYYVGSGDYSVAQVTDAPSNSGLTYSLRVSRTASTTGYLTFQMIELPATGQAGQFYNGAKFTFSGYVKGTSGATITPTLRFSTGTGGSNGSSFTRTEGAFTCNGSWQPFTFHFTVDENVGGSDKCVQSYFTFVTTATGQNVFFTGLQLEAGDTATSFEHRSAGEEFARCQRYYQQYVNISAVGYVPNNSSRTYSHGFFFPVEMRAAPTMSITNTGSSNGQYITDGQTNRYVSSVLSQGSKTTHMSVSFNISGDLSDYRGAYLFGTGNTTYQTTYKIDAEL